MSWLSILREAQTALRRHALLSLWLLRERGLRLGWTHIPAAGAAYQAADKQGRDLTSGLNKQTSTLVPESSLPTICLHTIKVMTPLGFIAQWSTCNEAPFLPGILFPLQIIHNMNCYLVIVAHAIDFANDFILFTTTVFLAKCILSKTLSFLSPSLPGTDSILKILHVKPWDCDLLRCLELHGH